MISILLIILNLLQILTIELITIEFKDIFDNLNLQLVLYIYIDFLFLNYCFYDIKFHYKNTIILCVIPITTIQLTSCQNIAHIKEMFIKYFVCSFFKITFFILPTLLLPNC
jgi:hypothetical protein